MITRSSIMTLLIVPPQNMNQVGWLSSMGFTGMPQTTRGWCCNECRSCSEKSPTGRRGWGVSIRRSPLRFAFRLAERPPRASTRFRSFSRARHSLANPTQKFNRALHSTSKVDMMTAEV